VRLQASPGDPPYNHHKDQMAVIRECVPAVVRAQLEAVGTTTDTVTLYEQVRDREQSIQRLRQEAHNIQVERDAAVAYARDLHERLRPELEAISLEQARKVRPLRIVVAAQPLADRETDSSDSAP
jgi:hypothetical protein